MDFVQRFQAIQLHRDTSDELIKVCTYLSILVRAVNHIREHRRLTSLPLRIS